MAAKSLILGSLLAFFARAILASASCNSFQVVDQTFSERGESVQVPFLFQAGYNTYRVGNGIVCDTAHANPSCGGSGCLPEVVNGTVITAAATSNITHFTCKQDAAQVFSLAGRALNMSLPLSLSTTMGSAGAEQADTCIPEGTAAYLEFVPEFNCVEGILTCDAKSSIPDQTPVYLCAPAYADTPGVSSTELSGDLELIETSPEVASTLTTLPPTPGAIAGYPASTPVPVAVSYQPGQTPVPH